MDIIREIDIGTVLIQCAVLLFSLSIHEASHAWVADRLGDYTARYLGRVTLNPLKHMDLIGTVVFPILQIITHLPLIGWAKPVPVNPDHLKNRRRDQMLISLAGPGSNLLVAISSFGLLVILKRAVPHAGGLILSMIANMSIPPGKSVLAPLLGILFFSLIINLALALFNLIPIPPLDGHWMLYGLLPYNAGQTLERIGSYGFLVIYGLMFLGMFRFIFIPVHWALSLLFFL